MRVEGTEVTRLGDYELVYEIKSGGMGKVFLARKRGTGGFEKLVAIKTILSELSERTELRTMFLDEAQLLARLEHPAVAQVHDFGEHEQTLFLAMEYVPGVAFSDLKNEGTPPGVAMRLVAQVCRALHAAHELRDLAGNLLEVVHRDVSPDNLMLTYDGHVKVLDFGIALVRGRQSPVTEFGTIKGKPPYLSPEQVKGKRVDHRSDVWSVGVVLWELLTGQNLFGGDSIFAIALAVDEQELVPPSRVAGQLPDGLDEIVMRALSRSVEERFQSAGEMADALEQLALEVSAPSIADFADVALSERREAHRTWLRDVLADGASMPRVGRATGQQTLPAAAIAEAEARLGESDTLLETPVVAPTRRRTMGALVLVAVVALVAGISWSLLQTDSSAERTLAASEIDASREQSYSELDAGSARTGDILLDASIIVAKSEPDSGVARKPKKSRGGRASKPPEKDTPAPDPPVLAVVQESTGTLTIAAEPYALVRVNGKDVGATPQLQKRYPPGTYVIELIHPDSGALRLRKTVKLQAGGHKSVIDRP